MEKNAAKTFSFGRRKLSMELDSQSSPPATMPSKPSPSPRPSPRPLKLPSPRPSCLPSPHTKKHAAKDTATLLEGTNRLDDPPELLPGFGKIFQDVDNFILALSSSQECHDHKSKPADTLDSNDEIADKDDGATKVESGDMETQEKEEADSSQKPENWRVVNGDQSKSEETCSDKEEVPDCVTKFLNVVEGIVIGRHDSGDQRSRWNEVPEGDMLLLESIDQISKMVKVLSEPKSSSKHPDLFNRAGKIQHRAMSFLEDQLRFLLQDPSNAQSNHEGGDNRVKDEEHDKTEESESDAEAEQYPEYPNDIVSCMKSIAIRMLSAGYEAECCHVYMITRQNALDDHVYKVMGFERIGMDDMQKISWEVLEQDISTWITTCQQCAAVYFPGEVKLVREIFTDHPEITACLCRKLLSTVLMHLLNFAEAVAMLKRTNEKLFKVLDMYENIRDTIMSMESSLLDEFAKALKTEATTARSRLGEAAISIFCDLENSIRSETGKTPVPGGAVHPLSRYTLNYLNYACHYKETLEQVFKEHSKIERADSTSRPRHDSEPHNYSNDVTDEKQSPFSVEIVKVMDMLDANLEAKSKLYKDIALSSIFMMNNGRYILQKIKKSPEIHQLMGDTWSRRRSTELRNYHKIYQRETMNKLLGCLGHEGLMSNGKVVKPILKERFKSFNTLFEEIHKTQSTWVVSDEQLQSELRISISSLVIPAYRSFVGRFSQYLDPGRQYEKYVKFQPEDIETCIDELFEGNAKKR